MAKDRYKYFRLEAREIVDGLAQGLLDLERAVTPELISRLLRLAHTLKGAARIVGHRELTELSHQMEDVLAPLRQAPAAQRLDAGLALVDQMASQVAALQESAPAAEPVRRPDRTQMIAVPTPATAPTTPLPAVAEPVAAPAAPPATPPAPVSAAPIPRADPTAVDDVLATLAEIHAMVRRLRGLDDVRRLDQRIDQIDRELRGVRQEVERLRLLAAGASFTALERTARDAARDAGKRVAFSASGGDVRADAHVLATLHGALVQLVRNAVAHGIEKPEVRLAAGKPAEGKIEIAVALHGSRIAITCRDDGQGIDLEAVRRAAVRRGMPEAAARALDHEQLIDLMMRGGLSTATEVTTLAGRGIGLDVVRDAAEALGGTVTAKTTGAGTMFKIVVPTSVAATAALVVAASDRICAIPLGCVRRVIRLAELAVVNSPDGAAVALDDVMLPFAPLGRLIGTSSGAPRSVVIIDGPDGAVAIGVERVIGVDDMAVRALPAGAPIEPLVWGVGVDSEGLPRPILDPGLLIAGVRATPALHTAPVVRPLPILVVDDSLTTRMLEQSILESAGFDVDLAASAEEGLAKVAERTYGLVLSDVEMPGMDGFAFVSALRSDPEQSGLPAILVTSRSRPDDLARGVAVGAQGYVVKGDFDQNKLLDLIRRLVRT